VKSNVSRGFPSTLTWRRITNLRAYLLNNRFYLINLQKIGAVQYMHASTQMCRRSDVQAYRNIGTNRHTHKHTDTQVCMSGQTCTCLHSQALTPVQQVSTYYFDILPVYHGHSDGKGLQVSHLDKNVQDWKLFLVLEYCEFTLGIALHSKLCHM